MGLNSVQVLTTPSNAALSLQALFQKHHYLFRVKSSGSEVRGSFFETQGNVLIDVVNVWFHFQENF